MPKFKGAIKGMSKKIIELNKKAAEQSNAKAGFNHDIIYFKGESVEKDQREAILQHLKINILNNWRLCISSQVEQIDERTFYSYHQLQITEITFDSKKYKKHKTL